MGRIGDSDCSGGGGGGEWGGDEDNETDKFGVAMPLAALVVTEGSGNLYLTKVAVGGPAGTAGVDATIIADAGAGATVGAATATVGAATATTGVGATACASTTGVGTTAGAKCLKIIRLFRILISPRSNVINPFNISLVDDIYDSTKS